MRQKLAEYDGGVEMSLNVEIYQENGKGTIKINGVLDIVTMDYFLSQLEHLNENELTSLSVDFSQLEFIDSTGIGAIMELIYLSQEKKFSVRLEGMDDATREIFDIIGVFTILETFQKEGV